MFSWTRNDTDFEGSFQGPSSHYAQGGSHLLPLDQKKGGGLSVEFLQMGAAVGDSVECLHCFSRISKTWGCLLTTWTPSPACSIKIPSTPPGKNLGYATFSTLFIFCTEFYWVVVNPINITPCGTAGKVHFKAQTRSLPVPFWHNWTGSWFMWTHFMLRILKVLDVFSWPSHSPKIFILRVIKDESIYF